MNPLQSNLLCDRCDQKAFYDADVDYDIPSFGGQWVLCRDCLAQVNTEAIYRLIREGLPS